MILYYRCIKCREINFIKEKFLHRGEITTIYPNGIVSKCEKCMKESEINPNSIYARESKKGSRAMIITLLITLIPLGYFIFNKWNLRESNDIYKLFIIGMIVGIPSIFGSVLIAEEQKSCKIFNSYYV